MSVRRQTLEEWFTDYQLMKMAKRHYHMPIVCRVDISAIAKRYGGDTKRIPLTAMIIRAAAQLAKAKPEVNRALIRAPWGTRIVQFSEAHVNVPLTVTIDGKKVLSAVVIRNADALTLEGIQEAIKTAQARSPDKLPIARRMARSQNTLGSRLILKFIHFVAQSFPGLYFKHGGGISVSSLVRTDVEGLGLATISSNGPTALTLCPGPIEEGLDGKVYLHMGVGYDHCAVGGVLALRAVDELNRLIAKQ